MTRAAVFKPPKSVQGMKELDRTAFVQEVSVPAIVADPKSIGLLLRKFQRLLLRQDNLKHVVPYSHDKTKRLILLLPGVADTLTEEEEGLLKDNCAHLVTEKLVLTYDNYSKEEALKAVLPPELGSITTAFETVGHIAHMNLRDKELEYKNVIGTVILDKTPSIRTVVNKTNTIDSKYRQFKMELLAGENEMQATVNEHGCTFKFDFSKVFWNSRLQLEHRRLTEQISPEDIVYDVFAGVGPFAIPAAKKGCRVYANDLNPASYEALKGNAKLNKVGDKIEAFNLDGHAFIQMLVMKGMEGLKNVSEEKDPKTNGRKPRIHVVMNLPGSAIDFLIGFTHKDGLPNTEHAQEDHSVTVETFIHCYCFSKSDQPLEDALERVEDTIGCKITTGIKDFHLVRDVAPNKVMVCATFCLPWPLKHCLAACEGGRTSETESRRGVKRPHEDDCIVK